MKDPTCEERIDEELGYTLECLERLWISYKRDSERYVGNLGRFDEYHLWFGYEEGGTSQNKEAGYWQYQLSTGGPGDEFRFFTDGEGGTLYKIEYWYLEWWDGASREIVGRDREYDLLKEIFDYLRG